MQNQSNSLALAYRAQAQHALDALAALDAALTGERALVVALAEVLRAEPDLHAAVKPLCAVHPGLSALLGDMAR